MFKSGDKVICISQGLVSNGDLKIGNIYTIEKYHTGLNGVYIKENEDYVFDSKLFKLYVPEPKYDKFLEKLGGIE